MRFGDHPTSDCCLPDRGSVSESTCFCLCSQALRVTSPQGVVTQSRPFCTSLTGDFPTVRLPLNGPVTLVSFPPCPDPSLPLSALPFLLLQLCLPHLFFPLRTLCRGEYSILHRLKAASECWGLKPWTPDREAAWVAGVLGIGEGHCHSCTLFSLQVAFHCWD